MNGSPREMWHRLGDRFSGEHAQLSWHDGLGIVAIVGAIVGLFWLLRWLNGLRQEGWLTFGQMGLFHELCTAHRLDRKSRRLILRVARHHDLPPAALFLRPDLMCSTPNEVGDEEKSRLDQLTHQLFAGADGP